MKADLKGAFENNSRSVHELQFTARTQECDRRSFHKLDTNTIRQRTLDRGCFPPGNGFELSAPSIERHAQNAFSHIGGKNVSHGGTTDELISDDLNLVRSGELNAGREQKIGRAS